MDIPNMISDQLWLIWQVVFFFFSIDYLSWWFGKFLFASLFWFYINLEHQRYVISIIWCNKTIKLRWEPFCSIWESQMWF